MDSDSLIRMGANRWDMNSRYRLVDGLSDYCRMVERVFDLRHRSVFTYEPTDAQGKGTNRLVVAMWMDQPRPQCVIGGHFVVLQNGALDEPDYGLKGEAALTIQRNTSMTLPDIMKERMRNHNSEMNQKIISGKTERREYGKWLQKKLPNSRVASRMARGITF